ncbi:MAG: PEP/pyruvate-binding domain-containing protein [Candidatus Heimdallarchaeota archaeon]
MTETQDIPDDDLGFEYRPKYKIFHELMKNRINRVLLVSSYYDSFLLEEDGRLSDQVFEEFHSLNLRTLPNITRAGSPDRALELLEEEEFDLVITMRRLGGGFNPFSFGKKVKNLNPNLPVVLLLTHTASLTSLAEYAEREEIEYGIDDIFLWNGDSAVFVAIIKLLEDKLNVEHDTSYGLVRVIIIIEDNIKYFSLFLPLIYGEIMTHTHRLISEGLVLNDYYSLLAMRARPKILLAQTNEEAITYYQKYKQYVIGIISDVRFPKNGKLERQAGFNFIKKVKKTNPTLPIALQSSEKENAKLAEQLDVYFIYKKSPLLLKELRTFLIRYLGFGDFVFRLPDGTEVGRASNIMELYQVVSVVNEEALVYHGSNDHFSGWLMNRAEFDLALRLKPIKVTDFDTAQELRSYLLNALWPVVTEKTGAVVHTFSRETHHPDNRFTRLRPGSLGGKGRGVAFLQYLLNSFLILDKLAETFSIRIPKTFVIGTDEFDRFMASHRLYETIISNSMTDEEIKTEFLRAKLTKGLRDDLKFILRDLSGPLAVRSSSILEDSQYQPFAGIFHTYMIPNNPQNQNLRTRLRLLCNAIKLVYASTVLKEARSYTESMGYSIEEIRMAVVIQQVVGQRHEDDLSYPSFSGVASSLNYYTMGSYMNPEDRVAFLAVGMGKTIVDGEISFRFCPKYPQVSFYSTQNQLLANSQREFYAIDLSKQSKPVLTDEESFLVKKSIFDLDRFTLSQVADTYDYDNQMLRAGYNGEGAPVITFSKQLKYETLPLASLITKILQLGERAFGAPIEFEFAGNFQKIPNKPATFYMLQVRPLIEHQETTLLEQLEINTKDDLLVRSIQTSGNRIIADIQDLVYVVPERFNKLKTAEMVEEIRHFNELLAEEKKPYILIGPGRWGSLDSLLGIPVKWSDISGVQVLCEVGLKDFKVEHSQGSHFFQNIVTANIPYLYIHHGRQNVWIDWDWLANPALMISETEYIRQIRAETPFIVRVDGKTREGIITKPKRISLAR